MSNKNNDEIMKVLELLEKGVINVDETKDLIGTLRNANSKSLDFDIDKLQKSTEKLVKDVSDKLNDAKTKLTPKVKEAFENLSNELEKTSNKLRDMVAKHSDEDCDCCDEYDEDELLELDKLEDALEEFEDELEELLEELDDDVIDQELKEEK